MSTHTPGPYDFTLTGRITKYDPDGNGYDVANVNMNLPFREMQANIYLLKSAPDMLHMLKLVLARLDLEEDDSPRGQYMLAAFRNDIRQLIAKAEGR